MGLLRGKSPRRSASTIAGIYWILGVAWILFSDKLVSTLATTPEQMTQLQSVKGIAFITMSAATIFLLVYVPLRRLASTNDRLESALLQAQRLHRVLRHNLRNKCQAIAGHTELLAERIDPQHHYYTETIRESTGDLISLSRKSVFFREFLDVSERQLRTRDLADSVRTVVDDAREAYPTADVTAQTPPTALAQVHKFIDQAIEELVENAIVHNDSETPEVHVEVEKQDETVTISVHDNGPGLPPMERKVLEEKTETQMQHSQGLGLWLVYLTVTHSAGTLRISDDNRDGTTIEFTVPAAS